VSHFRTFFGVVMSSPEARTTWRGIGAFLVNNGRVFREIDLVAIEGRVTS